MGDPRIQTVFIDRKNKKVIGEAASLRVSPPPKTAVQVFLDSVNPQSKKVSNPVAPTPSSLNYNIDLFQFTDVFDFSVALAPDEDFEIRSHDFVEFIIFHNGTKHQIGVGFIEGFNKETTASQRILRANGRDLMGQFMSIPFNVQLKRDSLTLRRFIDKMIKGSYLEEYLNLRRPGKNKIRDVGSFKNPMLFLSDLEQSKGQILQQYADLALNLVYMNRKGQIEILGRFGTFGSTAPKRAKSPVGTLIKGKNIESFKIIQNYTNVYSEVTRFFSEGEGIQDINSHPGSRFQNTDPRVQGHIFQPEFRVFNSTDLITIGGGENFTRRMRDVAKSAIRISNRNLQTIIATTTEPFFFLPNGFEVAYDVGQLFVLKSNEREFTSRSRPEGTDTIEMILTGINYSQNEKSLQVQLKFNEPNTLL